MSAVVGIDASLRAAGIATVPAPHLARTPNVPGTVTVGATGHRSDSLIQRARRVRIQAQRIWRHLPDKCALVVIETLPPRPPAHGSAFYVERGALIIELVGQFDRRSIPVATVSPTALKLWATGSGSASKGDMIAAMRDLWPAATITDDNQADALALASLGAQKLGWHEPELPHHWAPKVEWPLIAPSVVTS